VRVSQLHKSFGRRPALRGVDLDVADGERVAVLGPSGCGKTTLLRIVAGLERADSGRISIDGRDLDALPPHRRGVAMVMQSGALYPHLRVRANIEFPLRMLAMPTREIDQRVAEVTAMLDIDGLLERRPATLSGGERQRVAIARALAHPARTLLLDEPFASLDAPLRLRLRRELRDVLNRDGRRTILVTHDQEEAIAIGHRIAVMDSGSVLQVGTADHLLARPNERRVAAFLGSPPMSFIEVALRRENDDWIAASRCGDWSMRLPCSAVPDRESGAFPADVILGLRGGLAWEERADAPSPDRPDETTRLRGVVARIEPLGGHVDIELSLGAGVAVVVRRTPSSPIAKAAVGAVVEFILPATEIHLFTADGARLPSAPLTEGATTR